MLKYLQYDGDESTGDIFYNFVPSLFRLCKDINTKAAFLALVNMYTFKEVYYQGCEEAFYQDISYMEGVVDGINKMQDYKYLKIKKFSLKIINLLFNLFQNH